MAHKANSTAPVVASTATAVVATALPPVTIQSPQTTELATEYSERIAPLLSFKVVDEQTYIYANQMFGKVGEYIDKVDRLFEETVSLANKTHKALTALRGAFRNPGELVKNHLNGQIFAWREKLRREDEERRRQAEEAERRRVEEARQKLEAERAVQEELLLPWEESELPPVEVAIPDPQPVILPSSIPVIPDGPSVRKKPWQARVADPVKLLRWIADNYAERSQYVEFRLPALNAKARELEAKISDVIPGVEGYQGETLVS